MGLLSSTSGLSQSQTREILSAIAALNGRLLQQSLTLASIQSKLDTLISGASKMALDITALQTAVANETTVDNSVLTLISGLAAQITDLIAASGNTVDPVALQAIVTQMTTNAAGLQAAVSANTPAAPASPALSANPSVAKG